MLEQRVTQVGYRVDQGVSGRRASPVGRAPRRSGRSAWCQTIVAFWLGCIEILRRPCGSERVAPAVDGAGTPANLAAPAIEYKATVVSFDFNRFGGVHWAEPQPA